MAGLKHIENEDHMSSDQELQYEACCIIFGSEMIARQLGHTGHPEPSWLRDVLMSAEKITREARTRALSRGANARLTQLKIRGKATIFQDCTMESRLQEFAKARGLLGLQTSDEDLQQEAGAIVHRMQSCWPGHTAVFPNLLVRLIYDSIKWTSAFRERAGLPSLSPQTSTSCLDDTTFPSILPQQQHEVQYNELSSFPGTAAPPLPVTYEMPSQVLPVEEATQLFLNDDNCYRRLTRGLTRFVETVMSSRNPARHVPTDEELQHQARWIMFDG